MQVLDDKILEKPGTPEEAKEMLRSLSGRSHVVYTAVSLTLRGTIILPLLFFYFHYSYSFISCYLFIYLLLDDSNHVHTSSFVEGTSVLFADLSDQCIDAYVKTGTPMYVIVVIIYSFFVFLNFNIICMTGTKLEGMEFKKR